MLKVDNKADLFHYRTLLFILCCSLLALIGRYYYLQVIEYERHFSKSQINRVKAVTTYAPRGLILDRSGEILVDNYPTYILTVKPYKLEHKEAIFKELAPILNTNLDELNRRYKKYYRSKFLPAIIGKNLSFEQISEIEERRLDFPGLEYERFDERIYPSPFNEAHFLGYLREVDRDTIPYLDKSLLYRAGELIGWQGVEKHYEKQLRFSKGIDYIEVDTYGREIFELEENKIPAFPGENLALSIDSNLQKFVKGLLGEKKGSVIISDVNSGEILSMVSSPSYDLGVYRGTTSEEDWDKLLSDVDKPLLNRSISGLYPAGSMLKLITTINLLEDNAIALSDSTLCVGAIEYGGNEFRCWNENGHGYVDLNEAIIQSCNIYFYEKVQLLSLESWVETARNFGFNSLTEIDLPNEKIGLIPDREFFTKQYGRWGWSERGVLLNLTLGQGDILVTPIQGLRFINHIASKGETAKLKMNLNKDVSYYAPIEYSDKTWDYIWSSLFDVINATGGTGWRAMSSSKDFQFFGKTGTAENPHGEAHASFIGFFELNDNNRYSIVIIIENGGSGGSVAAPLAGDIASYFINNSQKYLADK